MAWEGRKWYMLHVMMSQKVDFYLKFDEVCVERSLHSVRHCLIVWHKHVKKSGMVYQFVMCDLSAIGMKCLFLWTIQECNIIYYHILVITVFLSAQLASYCWLCALFLLMWIVSSKMIFTCIAQFGPIISDNEWLILTLIMVIVQIKLYFNNSFYGIKLLSFFTHCLIDT